MTQREKECFLKKKRFSLSLKRNSKATSSPSPENTHDYLRTIYGDNYMTPPSPEKRETHSDTVRFL